MTTTPLFKQPSSAGPISGCSSREEAASERSGGAFGTAGSEAALESDDLTPAQLRFLRRLVEQEFS